MDVSAIDNKCIDKTRDYSISPFINGISDHDAQVITLKNIFLQKWVVCEIQYLKKCEQNHYNRFPTKIKLGNLKQHIWGKWCKYYIQHFLNTYLRIFYSSFIKKKIAFNHKYNPLITTGISILCNEKKELCLKYSVSSISDLKFYCKQYCEIWSKSYQSCKENYTMIKWFWTLKIKWKLCGRLLKQKQLKQITNLDFSHWKLVIQWQITML